MRIILIALALLTSFEAQAGHRHTLTLHISFSPAMPSIPDTAPVGTVIATVTVTRSDGLPFTGSLGFAAPYNSGGGVCAISGREIVLGINPPDGVVSCTVTATQ